MSTLVSAMLDENPRRTIRRALVSGELTAAIVPTAATEQHNEHLAMNHDTRSVMHIARRAAERLLPAVVVTPPLAIGISEHWMDHKGTLTLTPETFCTVVYEVCDSLRRHGFRHILILNGHGGNTHPLLAYMPTLKERLGISVDFCCYWDSYPIELVKRQLESGECPAHAAEFETSFALAAFPENVYFSGEPYPENELTIVDPSRRDADRRYHKDASKATLEKGRVMADFATDWIVNRLHHTLTSGLPK